MQCLWKSSGTSSDQLQKLKLAYHKFTLTTSPKKNTYSLRNIPLRKIRMAKNPTTKNPFSKVSLRLNAPTAKSPRTLRYTLSTKQLQLEAVRYDWTRLGVYFHQYFKKTKISALTNEIKFAHDGSHKLSFNNSTLSFCSKF